MPEEIVGERSLAHFLYYIIARTGGQPDMLKFYRRFQEPSARINLRLELLLNGLFVIDRL